MITSPFPVHSCGYNAYVCTLLYFFFHASIIKTSLSLPNPRAGGGLLGLARFAEDMNTLQDPLGGIRSSTEVYSRDYVKS